MQCIIEKENNFKQPGERYRSWAPDRYLCSCIILTINLHMASYKSAWVPMYLIQNFVFWRFFVILFQARAICLPMGWGFIRTPCHTWDPQHLDLILVSGESLIPHRFQNQNPRSWNVQTWMLMFNVSVIFCWFDVTAGLATGRQVSGSEDSISS